MDNQYGILLDGEVAIGKFVFITPEDSNGERQIMRLQINSSYIDVCNGKSQMLRCLLVKDISKEQIRNPELIAKTPNPLCIKIMEDLGTGTLEGRYTIDEEVANYKIAKFVKTPLLLDRTLN